MKRFGRPVAVLLVFAVLFSLLGLTSFAEDVTAEDVSEILTTLPSEPPKEDPPLFTLNLEKSLLVEKNGVTYTLFPATVFVDVTDDARFTAADARVLLRASAKLQTIAKPIEQIDVTGDGKLAADDARFALRATARLDKLYLTASKTRPVSGLVKSGGKLMFILPNGTLGTGYRTADGDAYYFDQNGVAKTGVFTQGDTMYAFGSDGKALDGIYEWDGAWYLFAKGITQTGWNQYGEFWYYCGKDGKMTRNQTLIMENLRYVFDAEGRSQSGRKGMPLTYKIAMLGDSLVAGMDAYGPTDKIDFYGRVGLHTDELFYKSVTGSSRNIIDEVVGRGYNKIILIIGANDIGYYNDWYRNEYRKAIRGLKSRCPDADIYAHGLMPINEARSYANGYSITNAQIRARTAIIRDIAASEGVKFLDPLNDFGINGGQLPYDAAPDGIHFGYTWCVKWANWLLEKVKY